MKTHITDYNRYTKLMQNGEFDKLFFFDKIFDQFNTFVDYGSADGYITNEIEKFLADKLVVGYDESEEMTKLAREKYPRIMFYNDWNFLVDSIGSPDVIYTSSLIHEVYSYGTPESIEEFWERMFGYGAKYIIIRDMMYSKNLRDELSDLESIRKVTDWCYDNSHDKALKEFEYFHGPIGIRINLIHFLLKYKYISTPNWPREVQENYLALSISQFKKKIPDQYEIFYSENYTLPYFKHEWQRDFDLCIDEKIHAKYILKLKS